LLKITEQGRATKDSIALVLEGRLAGPWVEELNALWNTFTASQRGNVLIDLSGVTFIDARGKTLLDRLWREGAKLRAAGCLTRCIVEEITGGMERDEEDGQDRRRCS
jgi:ABC-type transporter Mla MlaB component